jgi:hypothetical protein
MIHLGQFNTLTLLRITPPGAYLGDDEDNVVLLPTKYIPETPMTARTHEA